MDGSGAGSLSPGVLKRPLVASSEGLIGNTDRAGNDKSYAILMSRIHRKTSELNCVSPEPLRNDSDTSTSSGTSSPNDCQACGSPWNVLFDSAPTHQCKMIPNSLSTECVHSRNCVIEDGITNRSVLDGPTGMQSQNVQPESALPAADSRHELISEVTKNDNNLGR